MNQPNIPSLLHLGGDIRGKRKALLIHGIRSQAQDMEPIAETLLETGMCDAVWAYDSWAYHGVINPRLGIRTPSYAVHGAAQEITGLFSLLGWKDVTLIGHSFGGIVARCAAEHYKAHKYLKILVTLGTPHALWQGINMNQLLEWEPVPHPKLRYLQIVGDEDLVVLLKRYGNLSDDDASLPNVVKVLYPGHGHRSIRGFMAETYIPELIAAVRDTKSLFDKGDLLLTNTDQEYPVLSIRRDDSEYEDSKSVGPFAGQWLRFELEDVQGEKPELVTKECGHANVLIAGSTGVGKSTLINEVFQGKLAATGDGVPVTQGVRAYTKKGIPLTIFDSRGLELEDFDASKAEILDEVRSRRESNDSREHIHIAWLCISEDSRRVEEAHQHLAKELSEFMPVIILITKSRMDDGFRDTVRRLIPEARDVLSVRALTEKYDDGHVSLPMGLKDLVDLTTEVFPVGHRQALLAAQKVDLKRKKKHAMRAVATAAASAAAIVGANPIPAAGAIGLPAVYLAMFAGVNASYGLALSKESLATLVASAVGARGGMLAGPLLIGSLIKFIPGAGALAGGLISGATAAAIATTVGTIYVGVVHRLVKQNQGEPPSVLVLASELEKDLANREVSHPEA